MPLADRVTVSRRFQKAIRIDLDLKKSEALEGFVCPQSSAKILCTIANHILSNGQGAFTWTGPYGGGKSSLGIAMSALLDNDIKTREKAAKCVGEDTAELIWKALPPRKKGWKILPVVGRRDDPKKVIGETIESLNLSERPKDGIWSEKEILDILLSISAKNPKTSGGIIVFLDEMGKFLESAAQGESDVYLFQQLAETASRSKGRLIIIGVLHQAFEEYAHRLTREMRDEWSKIQGRFVDLTVNTAGEEQIDLLSRAIESDLKADKPGRAAKEVANCIKSQRPGLSDSFALSLENCWPLNPIVAALLGPISRRRFGQNQRSIFGFLNSAEPIGFQNFLHSAKDNEFYEPFNLWDYLRINLEPSILSSPDGHRWAIATDAVDRCEAKGGSGLQLSLIKTIALIDMFREGSGLLPTKRLLHSTFTNYRATEIDNALKQLERWALIVFRKHLSAYAIFAGSDFDLEEAVSNALEEVSVINFNTLKDHAIVQPILAKRHYHRTGSLRWFDVDITSLSQAINTAEAFQGEVGAIGKFLLTIPTLNEDSDTAQRICEEASRKEKKNDLIVGFSPRGWIIADLTRELLAVERVRNERTELRGDAVARREVQARLAFLQGQLENELRNAFDSATWYQKNKKPERRSQTELNILASTLANGQFYNAPRIHNELLNRAKPSKNAVAAQNNLLKRMVNNNGIDRLGIEGYPAEGGLFESLLYNTGLYQYTNKDWKFVSPRETEDPCNLSPIWKEAIDFLVENKFRAVSVSEIYALWRQPPYGLKDGLLPTFFTAFMLSQYDKIALYRDGIFQSQLSDLDIDYLTKDPKIIQLRWMDLSHVARLLLTNLAELVREIDPKNSLKELEPIDVARGLITVYDNLPSWSKRTMKLSSNANKVRNLFKKANDPNKFLFDDLPRLFGYNIDLYQNNDLQKVVGLVREGIIELIEVYPTMIKRIKSTLLSELKVPNDSPQAIAELRKRAKNIQQLSGDFRLDAFISRLTVFEGIVSEIEGLISLATNKPPRDWVDPDLDRASIEIADISEKFVRIEAFAHVKGRMNKRHAMAVILGNKNKESSKPLLYEFNVADSDHPDIEAIINNIKEAIDSYNINDDNIVLAALSELFAQYIGEVKPQGNESNI